MNAPTNKEPWQMTQDEYLQQNAQKRIQAGQLPYGDMAAQDHEEAVRQAIADGKSVSAEVLKDYPNLVHLCHENVVEKVDEPEKDEPKHEGLRQWFMKRKVPIGSLFVALILLCSLLWYYNYQNEREKNLIDQLLYTEQKEADLLTLQYMTAIKWDAAQTLANNQPDQKSQVSFAAKTKEQAVQNAIMLNSGRIANADDMSRIMVQIKNQEILNKATVSRDAIISDTTRLTSAYNSRMSACEWLLNVINNNDNNFTESELNFEMSIYHEDAMKDITENNSYGIACQELIGAIEAKYSKQYFDNETKIQDKLVKQDLSNDFKNNEPDFYNETKFFYQ